MILGGPYERVVRPPESHDLQIENLCSNYLKIKI